MNNSNEALPGNPGNLSGQPSYAEVERLAKELFEEAQRLHPNGGIVITIVAPGAQNIGHLGVQNIYQGRVTDAEEPEGIKPKSVVPPPEVMVKVVEKTILEGYWWANISWSVVFRIFQEKGYKGTVSQFVREVSTWPFTKPIRFDCNDDSVGKPIRSGRITRDISKWQEDGASAQFIILGEALLKGLKLLGY